MKVYSAGTTTKLSHASSILPPKAENGDETTKITVLPSIATNPKGRQMSKSTVMATGLGCSWRLMLSFIALTEDIGLNEIDSIIKNEAIAFLYLDIYPPLKKV